MKPLLGPWEPPVLELWIPFTDLQVPLHGFGFLVAIGFIVGGKVAMGRATRLGLDPEVINRLVGWLVVGTFVGGHVGFGLMYEPDKYLANPIEFLKVWQGLSSFGGFAVCVPISIWFFWKEKVPVWPYLDCLAHGMAIGWFFGRMGCFVAHDHPGTATDFWLGVIGSCKSDQMGLACHDMGLYEALWSLSVFGLFTFMDRTRTFVPGLYVVLLGTLYGPVRFAMDFLRPESTDPTYGGFTPGQYWAALLTVVGIAFLVQRMRSDGPRFEPVPPADEEPKAG